MKKITGWMFKHPEGTRGVTMESDRHITVKLTTESRETIITAFPDGRLDVETRRQDKRETTIAMAPAVPE